MLLISFGTRPEYIKIKPLLAELDGKIPYALLFTGQHTSLLENVIDTTDIRRLTDRPLHALQLFIFAQLMSQQIT